MFGLAAAVPGQAVPSSVAPGTSAGLTDTMAPRERPRATPRDSLRDSIQAPLAVAPRGARPEGRDRRVVWDREAILADGAVTLTDLLAEVRGVVPFHAGFIAAPTAAAWYGAPGRIRVFMDGIEWDALDPREGGTRDLATIPIWMLEEVAVERAAGELRVHLRSWRVDRTTPQTRTDILTGTEQVNLYRGFYGKRTTRGGALQLAAQQFSTTSILTGGDGDGLSAFGRVGFARGRLSLDGVVQRSGRVRQPLDRGVRTGAVERGALPGFEGDDAVAYLRAAWGAPDSTGLWAQVVAAGLRHRSLGDSLVGPDSSVTQAQYLVAIGARRGAWDLSGSVRMRDAGEEGRRLATAVRGSWSSRWAQVAAYGETGGPDSTNRLDLTLALSPIRSVQLLGTHAIYAPQRPDADASTQSASRLEVAATLWRRTMRAGVVRRSAGRVPGVPIFDGRFGPVDVADATGVEVGVRGPIVGPFTLSWSGIRWADDAPYRPRVESRTELRVRSGFERRLVRRTFELSAGILHEYRGSVTFPLPGGTALVTPGAGVYGALLDMRIGSAHVFWHNRNIGGEVYETVPGYLMPRLVQLYGVRWEFWN